jgi:hypothetical protein
VRIETCSLAGKLGVGLCLGRVLAERDARLGLGARELGPEDLDQTAHPAPCAIEVPSLRLEGVPGREGAQGDVVELEAAFSNGLAQRRIRLDQLASRLNVCGGDPTFGGVVGLCEDRRGQQRE